MIIENFFEEAVKRTSAELVRQEADVRAIVETYNQKLDDVLAETAGTGEEDDEVFLVEKVPAKIPDDAVIAGDVVDGEPAIDAGQLTETVLDQVETAVTDETPAEADEDNTGEDVPVT